MINKNTTINNATLQELMSVYLLAPTEFQVRADFSEVKWYQCYTVLERQHYAFLYNTQNSYTFKGTLMCCYEIGKWLIFF